MRKPDPLDSDDHPESKKRSSAAAMITATPYKSPNVMPCGHGNEDVDTEVRSSLEVVPPPSLSRFVPALLYLFSFTRQSGLYQFRALSTSFVQSWVCCGDVLP